MPLDIDRIRALRPQNELHYWPTLPSTMIEATRLATGGAPHGTVVLTDEQTAGIGRLGRTWISQAELGIYCSVLLRLALPAASTPIASLVLGLAAADAIQKSTQLACDLRWPNDVLIGEKKTAGILPHLVDGCIVAGIGMNVNQERFEANLRTPATSLRIESNGQLQSREQLIVQLLESLGVFCNMLAKDGKESVLRAFAAASSYVTNRRVTVEETGWRGTTAGLDENGFLLMREDSGQMQRIASGGVRPDYA
ncbi:MAG TPA: biotin--[acetyl-CoA-carboxylase] ligase [Bryobacteraceae bacterium]|jgi:BirA family biotin operon repressor/biotin-[acetyl-CoA-carboxylase] ligase